MKSRKILSIVQMNNSHAYFDLHQEMFWQGDHAAGLITYRHPYTDFAAVLQQHAPDEIKVVLEW